MPMRLPASCVTLSVLLSLSLVLSSSESSSSLSLSLSLVVLAVFVAFVALAVFVAFAGLAVLVALGVAAFLAGAGTAAAAGAGVAAGGAGAGTISAITFCRRIATTGQSGDLPMVVGMMARSALPLFKACALASALSVVTTCNCSRSWLFPNVLASTCTIFALPGPVAIRITVFLVE